MKQLTQAITLAMMMGIGASTSAAEPVKLNVQWSVNVDQRLPNAPVSLSVPAVMPHADATWLVMGGRDAWVHVYDAQGSEVRRFFLGGKSDSGALYLDNGLVVLGDTEGHLYAVDPVKGEIAWQTQLTAAFTSIPVAISGGFLVQTTDNRIYSFSQDGEKRWSFSGLGSVMSMYITPSPIVVDGRVYALLSNGDAVSLSAENGDVLWKRQLLLTNDSAVLSELQAPLATPTMVESLYMDGEKSKNTLLMPFFQGDILALSASDGSQYFNLPISLKSAPLIMAATLYAADSEGFLQAYDIEHGKKLWRKKISDHELIGPELWQGSIWLTDNKGVVYNVNSAGDIQASVALPGSIVRLPVVTEFGLLVRTDRGAMYMVNK